MGKKRQIFHYYLFIELKKNIIKNGSKVNSSHRNVHPPSEEYRLLCIYIYHRTTVYYHPEQQ